MKHINSILLALRAVMLLAALLLGATVSAQSYGLATGLRLGNGPTGRTLGLTSQYRILPTVTLEGVVQTDFLRETTAHFLIERHRRLISKRVNIYLGAGPSVGRETQLINSEGRNRADNREVNSTLGFDLIAGAEITLAGANISVDYKPNLSIIGRDMWYQGQVGISVREVIIKGNAAKKRKRKKERSKRQKERRKQREKDAKDEQPWLQDWWERNFKKKK